MSDRASYLLSHESSVWLPQRPDSKVQLCSKLLIVVLRFSGFYTLMTLLLILASKHIFYFALKNQVFSVATTELHIPRVEGLYNRVKSFTEES